MYEYTDKVLATLNRRLLRLFNRIKLLNIDELNVVSRIGTFYRQAQNFAVRAFLDAAIHSYLLAAEMAVKAGYVRKKANQDDIPIDAEWIQDLLSEDDSATLYLFFPEVDRKRQRLVEALAATNKRNQEIDRAMRYLSAQFAHYADKATMRGAVQGFKDSGVKQVRWMTERDERVCEDCAPLDGKIFNIDEVPQIPTHWRCRCWLEPVKER